MLRGVAGIRRRPADHSEWGDRKPSDRPAFCEAGG
jgi:hypothetical protein